MIYVDGDGKPRSVSADDDYVIRIQKFQPGRPDASAFQLPESCKRPAESFKADSQKLQIEVRLRCLIPQVIRGDPAYDAFLERHRRMLLSPFEYEWRLGLYLDQKRTIQWHNDRTDVSYQLEVNMYTDWTTDEFLSLRTGKQMTCSLCDGALIQESNP